MNKFFKAVAILAAAGAALLGAAAVAVHVFLPPEKLKTLAISAADKSLHRTLEVQSVEFGLLGGLNIQGLRLSESPDFSKGEFLKADSFTLRPEWLPLLRKEIVARKIELRGASVNVIKDADGKYNFSDLLGGHAAAPAPAAKKAVADAKAPASKPAAKSPAAEPAPHAAAAPLALAVNSLLLRDVALHYADKKQGAKADATINDLAVVGFGLSGPFSVSLDVKADYAAAGKRYAGAFKAKGKADLSGGDQSRVSADLSRFSLSVQDKEVLTGSLKFEDAKAPKVSLRLDAPAMDAKFLASLGAAAPAGAELPAVKLEADATYAAPALDVSSFKISAAGAVLSGSASDADVNSKNPRIKFEASSNEFNLAPLLDALPQFRGAGLDGKASVKLSASLADGVLALKRLELGLGGLDAKASGSVSGIGGKTPSFDLKLDTDRFALASLADGVESMKKFQLGGEASLSAAVSGTAASPRVSGTAALDGVAAKYKGQTLEKATGRIAFTQDSVDMPQLTGRLNGGDFKLKVAASNGAAPVATVSGWMSLLDLGALQKFSEGASAAAAPAAPQAAPTAPSASAAPSRPSRAPASAARKAPSAAPALKTSGDITVDRIAHPNFECGKAVLTWNLAGIAPNMSQLAGTAKLAIGSGKVVGIVDYAKERGGMVRALVVPLEAIQKAGSLHIPGLNVPDMQNIPFTKITGDYTAAKGVITMHPFLLDSPVINMNTTGTADLVSQTANLKTAVKLAGQEVDLAITGPFSHLAIKPSLGASTQKLLQDQGKALFKKFLHR